LDTCVATSFESESVAEYVVEDHMLGKETMSFAIGALISWVVERGQLIFCYSPLSANLIPYKVIVSEAKDSGKFYNTNTELVAFNGEVDGRLISIATSPSSRAELSYQLCVPILIHAKDIKYSKRMGLGNDFVEHWITLLLHISPINIEQRGNWILPFLDNYEIPIGLEIVPEMVIM
jgi:hypothetical protein